MEAAFEINSVFREKFRTLKPYLPAHKSDWGNTVVDNLISKKAFDPEKDKDRLVHIRTLYRRHSVIFRSGVFDETYLDSVEDIALFFAFCDVKTLWVASAYFELTTAMINFVFDRRRLNQSHSTRTLMQALTGALSLELNQIQRTFTMYERYVSDALVKDLTFAGMLTGSAKGVTPGRGLNSDKTQTGEPNAQ